ncbi:hypothetical protein BC830DRAFT_1130311 [Chytriomyces sp. MP71]|nr:hypothetical protein BC830DRAFT_1130311 [Chytriomyces sp. MP71]
MYEQTYFFSFFLNKMAFKSVHTRIYFHLPPIFNHDYSAGVTEQLNSYLMRYIPELNGIPISYSDVKIEEKAANVLYDSPNSHFHARVKFLLFSPAVDNIIVGLVNKVSSDHIGLLVHGVFNASISAEHIRKTEFKYNHGSKVWTRITKGADTADAIAPGSVVKFTIVGLPTTNNMLTIIGSLTASPTKTGLIALDPSKTPPHPTPIIVHDDSKKSSKRGAKVADGPESAANSKKIYFDTTAEENDALPEDQDEWVVEAAVKDSKKSKDAKKDTKQQIHNEEEEVDEEEIPLKKKKKSAKVAEGAAVAEATKAQVEESTPSKKKKKGKTVEETADEKSKKRKSEAAEGEKKDKKAKKVKA